MFLKQRYILGKYLVFPENIIIYLLLKLESIYYFYSDLEIIPLKN